MEYLYAKQLKKEFNVLAGFYNQNINGGIFRCRSNAYVIRKGTRITEKVDAVLILMNPGTSSPILTKSSIPTFYQELPDNLPLLEANPDPTQYQVMRLMKLIGWKSVSIINLSDLRAGNIDDFKGLLEEAEERGFHYHTIFSPERTKELNAVMNSCSGPLLIAWGTNKLLEALASNALSVLPRQRIIGIPYTSSPFYSHINPILKERQLEILSKMKEII